MRRVTESRASSVRPSRRSRFLVQKECGSWGREWNYAHRKVAQKEWARTYSMNEHCNRELLSLLRRRYEGLSCNLFSPTNTWRAIRPRRRIRTLGMQTAYKIFIANRNWIKWQKCMKSFSFVRASPWNQTYHLCRLKMVQRHKLAIGSPINVE